MSDSLTSGHYKVVSLAGEGDQAVGVEDRTGPHSQPVRIGGPIQKWDLQKDGKTILLRIGDYPVTQVVNNKVTVSTLPGPGQRWRATYRELQDAFTIALAENPSKGWTVLLDAPDDRDAEIEIRPIIATGSLPPQFIPTQLYRFERLDE